MILKERLEKKAHGEEKEILPSIINIFKENKTTHI